MSASLGALLLVVVSSLAWSGFDALRKLLVDRIAPLVLICLLTLASVPLFAVWVMVDGMPTVQPGYVVPALTSVVLNIAANLGYIAALRKTALSVTIPLLSLTPAFTALLAVPLLGERPTVVQGLGILMVVAGAIWLNLSGTAGRSPSGEPRSWRPEVGALWMVAVAIFWALAIPLDKLSLERASGPFHGLVLNAGVALGTLAGLAAQGRLRELAEVRTVRGPFAASLVVSAAALGLQLIAMQHLWVGLVETLKRGIGNLLAVLLGRLLFAEAVTLHKIAAVALMVAGVALVLLV
ncbi:MAG TPA: DMT family transporter [Thermoanaerobaculia bacterium]